MPIGVIAVDAALTIRTWSRWVEISTGIPSTDAQGRRLDEVIPTLGPRGLLARFQRTLDTGEAQVLAPAFHHYLIPCPPRSPSPHFALMQQRVTLGALREGGRVVGVMAAIEDVTPRLDAERTLAAELQSEDPEVRSRAAARLAAAKELHAPDAFAAVLRHERWEVRRSAVHGLARHASRDLLVSLIAALRHEHRDFNVLSSALQLLAMIDVDVTVPLAELLSDQDVDLRIQAALALGDQPGPRSIAALTAALEDPDGNVRFHAIEALGRLQSSDAVEALAAIAESRDFFLAFPAVDALARIADPRVAPRLVPLLADEGLCIPVAEALGRLGGGDVVGPLVAVLSRAKPPVLAIASAIAALHAQYEHRYGGGEYIVSEFQSAITPTATQHMLDALPDARGNGLRALVLLLGWVQSPAAERALTALLAHPDIRADVLEALVRRGPQVADLLIAQLDSGDEDLRMAAVVALGRLGDPRSTAPISRLLAGDRSIVIAAADALARIGDHGAFEPLLGLLGHQDAAVRQAAVGALNSLGHPAMPGRVIRLLDAADPRTRESAVRIAGYFGYPECADVVFARCSDDDDGVRRAALEHAPYLDEARALPVLVRALTDDTPRARGSAAAALGRVAGEESRRALFAALADPDVWVRYFAARALAQHAHESALEPLAPLAAADPAPHVRIAALEAIGAIGAPRSAAMLAPLADDGDADVGAAAIVALGRLADPEALPLLNRALRSADPARRLAAVHALAQRGDAGRVAALRWTAGGDSSEELGGAALRGLASLGAAPGDAWPDAVDALLDLTSEATRRDAAVTALARLPASRIDRVARGLRHAAADVRRAAIDALSRMKDTTASARLRAALDDDDAVVREAAIAALDRVGTAGLRHQFSVMAFADTSPAVRRVAAAALARQSDKEDGGGAR